MIGTCVLCGVALDADGAYCRSHRRRGRERRWVLTPHLEAILRREWAKGAQPKGWTRVLARRLGIPVWRLCRWAAELGIARPSPRGPNWTQEELAQLEVWHAQRRTSVWIARRLQRSVTAVTVKRKRLGLCRASFDGYSARQLAEAMGVDSHQPGRWIRQGWLRGTARGTDRRGGQHGDEWVITEAAVRAFLAAHRTAYDLRKVDQVWFLDLVFGEVERSEVA